MENLLWLLPLLACPVGMVLMMWLMGKGMSRGRDSGGSNESAVSVEELRTEHKRLAAQIARLDRDETDPARADASEQPDAHTRASAPSG